MMRKRAVRRFRWDFNEKDHRASASLYDRGKWVGGASRYWSTSGGIRWACYLRGATPKDSDRRLGRPCRTLAKARRRVEAAQRSEAP